MQPLSRFIKIHHQVPKVMHLQFGRSCQNLSPWQSLELSDAGDWAHKAQKYFFLYSFPGLALWTVWLWGFITQVGCVMPLLTRSWNELVLLTWIGCQWTLLCHIAGISTLFKVLQGSSTGGFVRMDLFQRDLWWLHYMVWIPTVILQRAPDDRQLGL